MLNKNFTQKGSMMVEALAMLGLIAMVTPVLYRKASERANELQDINVASQIRLISQAVDSYIQDNKSTLDEGNDHPEINFDDDIKPYLPQGFGLNSRLFDGFEIGVNRQNLGTNDKPKYSYTSAVLAKLRNDMTPARAAKIATIIGIAGGLYDDGRFNGAQGAWENDPENFGMDDLQGVRNNSIVAISNEAINKVVGEVDTEAVLYRTEQPDHPERNTMEVNLNMGRFNIENAGDIASQTITVTGDATIGGELSANSANISDELKAGSANITNLLQAGSADIAGIAINNEGINASGKTITAGSADIAGIAINNDGIDATGKKITAETIEANNGVIAGITINNEGIDASGKKITAASGIFDYLKLNGDLDMNDHDIKNVDNIHIHKSLTVGGGDGKDNNGSLLNVGASNGSGYILSVNASGIGVNVSDKNMSFNNEGLNVVAGESKNMKLGNEDFQVQMGSDKEVKLNNEGFYVKTTEAEFDVGKTQSNGLTFKSGAGDMMQYYNGTLILGGSGANVTASLGADALGGSTGNTVMFTRDGAIKLLAPKNHEGDEAYRGEQVGYIQARRLLSDKMYSYSGGSGGDNDAFLPLNASGSRDDAVSRYTHYQVNPAYTSVMNDIKLASRGGSRLSDILPDYINKGIYIAENNLSDLKFNWQKATDASGIKTDGDGNKFKNYARSNYGDATGDKVCGTSLNCIASPWLGFVPAPQCPPAYDKVITIEPFRWKMSQIYRINNDALEYITVPSNDRPKYDGHNIFPNDEEDGTTDNYFSQVFNNDNTNPAATLLDLQTGGYYNNAYAVSGSSETGYSITKAPVYFQTNTWLNTSMEQHNGSDGYPRGWSVIMGFLYHLGRDTAQGEYCDIYKKITGSNSCGDEKDATAWNLFPVRNKEMAAVVRVYCSFNRYKKDSAGWTWGTNSGGSPVYEYDQLHELEGENGVSSFFAKDPYAKNAKWVEQVNDPSLPYNDAW